MQSSTCWGKTVTSSWSVLQFNLPGVNPSLKWQGILDIDTASSTNSFVKIFSLIKFSGWEANPIDSDTFKSLRRWILPKEMNDSLIRWLTEKPSDRFYKQSTKNVMSTLCVKKPAWVDLLSQCISFSCFSFRLKCFFERGENWSYGMVLPRVKSFQQKYHLHVYLRVT